MNLSWREGSAIVGLLLGTYSIIVGLSAIQTLRSIDRVEPTKDELSLEAASDQILSISLAIGEAEESVRLTKSLLSPVQWICFTVDWMPVVGTQCDAYDSLFEIFSDGSASARSTLYSVGTLNGLLNSRDPEIPRIFSSAWMMELASVKADLNAESERIEDIRSAANESVDNWSVLTPMLHRAESVTAQNQSVNRFALNIVEALEVGYELADEMSDQFDNFSGGTRLGFSDYQGIWVDVAAKSSALEDSFTAAVNSLPESLAGTGIETKLTNVQDQIDPLLELVDSLAQLFNIFETELDAGRQNEGSFLLDGGLASMLKELDDNSDQLESAGSSLLNFQSVTENNELVTQILGGRGAKIESLLGDKLPLIQLLPELHHLLSDFVGINGFKRYLVLGVSPAEIRPAGGFTSSVWLLEFKDGNLLRNEYISVIEFGENDYLAELPPPPSALRTFMDARGWYLRDVGWSPDYEFVAENARFAAEVLGMPDLDGVITVNQNSIENLITVLGSLTVNGEEVPTSDLDLYIEEKTDESGTEFLAELFLATLDAFSSESIEDKFIDISRSLLNDLDSRNIMVRVFDKELHNRYEEIGWTGKFDVKFGEVVAVYDSNVGWNKVDTNIDRNIKYESQIFADGSVNTTFELNYTNRSKSDLETCPDQQPPRGAQNLYSLLKDGCYWNYVRIYVPANSFDFIIPDLVAPDNSIAVRSGQLLSGVHTGVEAVDGSGRYLAGLLVVPPGQKVSATFGYSLPPGTATTQDGSGLMSSVDVYPQPGLGQRLLSGSIKFPSGYQLVTPETGVVDASNGSIAFQIEMDSLSTLEYSAILDTAG